MRRVARAACGFIAAVCLANVVGCATKPAEEFPISFWCGPPEKFVTPQRYAEIREANFTVAFPACGGATDEMNHRILAYCKKAKLKAFIIAPGMPLAINSPADRAAADRIIAEYHDEPALAGYFLADEPGPPAFAGLGTVAAYFREHDPQHPVFINLLPDYAPEWAIGPSYAKYLEDYLTTVKPFALSYDHYHFTTGGDGGLFFANLEAARVASAKHHTPFWNIVLCTQHGPYRNLTEAELRFEAMQTLAYGGKGLVWFTYWTPSDPGFTWAHALINADGSRDPHYAMVQTINRDVLAMGKELLHAQCVSVDDSGNITGSDFEIAGGAYIQVFANRDYRKAVQIQIGQKAEVFDRAKRKWKAANEPLITIPPGDAVLVRGQ